MLYNIHSAHCISVKYAYIIAVLVFTYKYSTIMKAFALSFLILLLAFTACNDEYEQLMDDNVQTRALTMETNEEKFEFGKIYSAYNIPQDVYNHIPKDTLELLLFMQNMNGSINDSIVFYRGQYESTTTNDNASVANAQSAYFSKFLDSYNSIFTSFSLKACALYNPGEQGSMSNNKVTVEFYSYSTPYNLVIQLEENLSKVEFSMCVESVKPHVIEPCREGYICWLNVKGIIGNVASLLGFHSFKPLYKFNFSGRFTNLGDNYDYIAGSISDI